MDYIGRYISSYIVNSIMSKYSTQKSKITEQICEKHKKWFFLKCHFVCKYTDNINNGKNELY